MFGEMSYTQFRQGQRKDTKPDELDELTKTYQYNLWVQNLLEPTFHHIHQMTEGAVDIRRSLGDSEAPSYRPDLESAQARLIHWFTKHAGLPRHIAEDKANKELVFLEGWSRTTLFWNQEGWDEELFGPKPKKFASFADTVAGTEEDHSADDSPRRGFQNMSGVKEYSEHPIALEEWKPPVPSEMKEESVQAMRTHEKWKFRGVHRAQPVPPPGNTSSDQEPYNQYDISMEDILGPGPTSSSKLYDQYDISMEDIMGPSPTSSSAFVDPTGSGGPQQGKARKAQNPTSPTGTAHPLTTQEKEERSTQEGIETTGKGKLSPVPGKRKTEISLTPRPLPEMSLSPYGNVDSADDDDDDDSLGEIGDLPCHPLLDEPEPSQSTLGGPDMLKESENLASIQKASNVKATRRARQPRPAASAHVKASATKDMGQVRLNRSADGNEQLEWLDMARKEWRPAVYHSEIRGQLIGEAAQHGRYRFEMSRGKGEHDVTAFHPLFANNGAAREHWPKILFQINPTVADFQHEKPGIWTWHDGRVVLDLNNDAMRDFAEMPVTFARNADCWLLVTCMRLNNHISLQDFRGRMQGALKDDAADSMGRNRISMNVTRFRKFACCLTWNAIRGVDYQREYLNEKLPRRCIRLNSTESFRELDAWEVAELESRHAGKYLSRTSGVARDPTTDRARTIANRKKKDSNRLKAMFEHNHGGPRTDDYDAEDEAYLTQLAEPKLQEKQKEPRKQSGDSMDEPIDLENPSHDYDLGSTEGSALKPAGELSPFTSATGSQLVLTPHQRTKAVRAAQTLANKNRVNENIGPHTGNYNDKFNCPRNHPQTYPFATTGPKSIEDAELIRKLLKPTRKHFHLMTGTEAPGTEGDECYMCQFMDIEDALNRWNEESKVPGMKRGQLIGIDGVTDDHFYWNSKWNNRWYGPKLSLGDGRSQSDRTTAPYW
ncbi:MAG: hypothetical protein Q9183_002874 [Haloplaca sp. 2 TL-2023]